MHRLFGLLAVMAAGVGIYLLFDAAPSGVGKIIDGTPLAQSGWALGLLTGLALAWLASINWSTMPAQVVTWVRLQRRRLWLALLGGVCAGILVLF